MLVHLLEKMSNDDFKTLSEDIKLSISEHRDWVQQLNIAVVSRDKLHNKSLIENDSYLHCKFGQWITKILSDETFQQDPFYKIDHLHQEIHHSAKELIEALEHDHLNFVGKYKNFTKIQETFFNELLSIFEFSIINNHQFDVTTKLMNRRTIDTVLSHEHHLLQRNGDAKCCIAMADIDKFKNINDMYGHDVGDKLLEHTASILNESLRRHDTVARFGGEEFLFVLPDMDIIDAEKTIERIRKELSMSMVKHNGKSIGVTASFGITQLCQSLDIQDSIKRADVALYQAKAWGRNRSASIDINDIIEDIDLDYASLSPQERVALFKQHCKAIN